MIENNEINNPRNNLQLDDNELNTMSITKDQIKKLFILQTQLQILIID